MQRTATQSKQPDNLARWLEILARAMSGNISYGATMSNIDPTQNMNVWKFSGTTPPTANTEFAIPHHLKYVPLTILGADTSNGGVLYRSTTPWTAAPASPNASTHSAQLAGYVYLKCTTASAAYNVIFG